MTCNTKIICLTPIKNEVWILDTFLKCASIWADCIIIADQMSTDGSREIARNYEKVILIDNTCQSFNEPERQKLLIDTARKIEGERKILIALDADEILAGDLSFLKSSEFLSLNAGTVLTFDWLNIKNKNRLYWKHKTPMPFGFIDDGSNHIGRQIHSVRIPYPTEAHTFHLTQCPVLHLQYLDWQRMQSKHRWYECFEHLSNPKKSAIELFRQYHHMYATSKINMQILPETTLYEYTKQQINPFNYIQSDYYNWDYEILDILAKNGASHFRKFDIWSLQWNKLNTNLEKYPSLDFSDPRTLFEKLISWYLIKSQVYYPTILFRAIDKILKLLY